MNTVELSLAPGSPLSPEDAGSADNFVPPTSRRRLWSPAISVQYGLNGSLGAVLRMRVTAPNPRDKHEAKTEVKSS